MHFRLGPVVRGPGRVLKSPGLRQIDNHLSFPTIKPSIDLKSDETKDLVSKTCFDGFGLGFASAFLKWRVTGEKR